MLYFIQKIDWSILRFIQSTLRCGFLDFLMTKITYLGSAGAVWIVAAIGLTMSKKYRRYGITLFVALLVGLLVGNVVLKNLIARPRPCWLQSIDLLIKNPKDYSFPSGHTLSSVIGAVVLTSANRKFVWFSVPLATLIAFSRLYLFVHFPSDVLSGAVLGLIIGTLSVFVCRKITAKNNL